MAVNNLGPELHIGYTRSFHNDFFVANAQTTPDMPIWLAVRASIAIPIILTPVLDFTSQDILCDGGLVNNTPIKWYLTDWWSRKPDNHKDCMARISTKQYQDASTQTDDNLEQQPESPTIQPSHIPQRHPKKYRQHFWCIDIKTLTDSPITQPDDLKTVSLATYLEWVIHKIFANQDSSRCKYSRYLCTLDCKDYTEIIRERFDLDMSTREIIINRAYEQYKNYYNEQLLTYRPH